ncbi:MAG: hypothetical protein EGQ29_02715 [Clostridiales bacterium]|nr:hypothetical protein [Clostridiales bacterium]
MKKLILLTICTILLLTGCGQAAAPEVGTVLAIVQEEAIPTTDTQDVPTGIAEVAVEPTISEIPAQSQQTPVVAPLEEPAVTVPAEQPTADTPTQTPEPAPNTGLDTMPEQTAEEASSVPPATGDIYSVEEAVLVGNEYAKAQYGATIDTSMTTAESSYYPGTADSVAWLSKHGGQAALNAAVCGNVDATFACLAALDGAEIVSAYARFNCAVHYNAARDEYIVVVLYG